MNSKERMMLALNGEKPDRCPVSIHQWQPYHLKNYMNGVDDITANKIAGFDAAITINDDVIVDSLDYKIETTYKNADGCREIYNTIITPMGVLTQVKGQNPMTTWVIEHLVKKYEDIELIKKYHPVPKIRRQSIIDKHNTLGDDGILRTFLCGFQGGCWQDACELYGAQELILAVYDNPDWVHEFLGILLEQKLKYIEQMKGIPFDLVETGGGASSNTLISPKIHEEFCTPYDKKLHDALHQLGFKVVYHTCGGMSKITHLIKANGCDVSETLSPPGVGGDIGSDEVANKVYQDLFPEVSLIGGMDQINILEKGSFKEIEREVDRLFNLYGKNGAYIMSACDHFFDASLDNLKHFVHCAKKYTY